MGQWLGEVKLTKQFQFAHELIRRDIEIIDVDLEHNETYTSQDIDTYSRWLKHQIYKACQGKTVGKTVYIDENNFLLVVCAMIASWELGANIFLNDNDQKTKSLPYFQNFFSVIDIVIGPWHPARQNWQIPNVKYVPSDITLGRNDILSWPLGRVKRPKVLDKNVPEFNNSLDQKITPDTICYYTTSSGTTGDPKIIPFTHYQTVTLSQEIKEYLNLTNLDRPYHRKTLHHGSLFNSFALPFLSTSQTHYSGTWSYIPPKKSFTSSINPMLKQLGISHFLVPYDFINEYEFSAPIDFEQKIALICIVGCSQDKMQKLFNDFNPRAVYNYFGVSEVGTMFISCTTKQNTDSYRPNRFTYKLPHIDYEFLPTSIKAKWQYQNDWFETADIMQKTQPDEFWHHGRDLHFVSQGQSIELKLLREFLVKYLGTDQFYLIPDYKLQRLYLNLYNLEFTSAELEVLNTKLCDTFGAHIQIYDCFNFQPHELQFGMKISGPLLLHLYRQRSKHA